MDAIPLHRRMHRRRASLPPEYEAIPLVHPQIVSRSNTEASNEIIHWRDHQVKAVLKADICADKDDLVGFIIPGGPATHAPDASTLAGSSFERNPVLCAPIRLHWPHASVMDMIMQQALAPNDPNLNAVLRGRHPSSIPLLGTRLSPSALADAINSCKNTASAGKASCLHSTSRMDHCPMKRADLSCMIPIPSHKVPQMGSQQRHCSQDPYLLASR